MGEGNLRLVSGRCLTALLTALNHRRGINSKAGFTRRPFFAGGAFLFLKTSAEFQGLFAGARPGFLKIVPAAQSWQLEASGRKKKKAWEAEEKSKVWFLISSRRGKQGHEGCGSESGSLVRAGEEHHIPQTSKAFSLPPAKCWSLRE